MVKNVKIDDEAHRMLSVKAAELAAQKGELCSILIRAALQNTPEAELKQLLKDYAPVNTETC